MQLFTGCHRQGAQTHLPADNSCPFLTVKGSQAFILEKLGEYQAPHHFEEVSNALYLRHHSSLLL